MCEHEIDAHVYRDTHGFPSCRSTERSTFTAIYGKGRDKFQFFFVSFSVFLCDRLRMYVSTYTRNRERQKLRIRMPRQVGGSAVSLFSPLLLPARFPSSFDLSCVFAIPAGAPRPLVFLSLSLPFSPLLYLFFFRSTRECASLDLFKCANLSGDLRCWPCRRIFSLFLLSCFFPYFLFLSHVVFFIANFALWPSSVANERTRSMNAR